MKRQRKSASGNTRPESLALDPACMDGSLRARSQAEAAPAEPPLRGAKDPKFAAAAVRESTAAQAEPPLRGAKALKNAAAAAPPVPVVPLVLPQEPVSRAAFTLPTEPMAPVTVSELPQGDDWAFQLKWDGVRILAELDRSRSVRLFSRSMYLKNAVYPEIAEMLADKSDALGPCLLDGEVVWWDGERPNFQQVLKRERISAAAHTAAGSRTYPESGEAARRKGKPKQTRSAGSNPAGLLYVLFDLLADETGDLRHLPYSERHRRLLAKCPKGEPRLFVADLYRDGAILWDWVEKNRWEGVVAKRLSSPYREGKKHRDWLKRKTALLLDVDIVGLKWRSGVVASLVMAWEGDYLGSVSLGLNDALRGAIAGAFRPDRTLPPPAGVCPFARLPDDLKREQVQWLPIPFKCRVTGLEITAAGQLRHPKLVTFLPKEPLP